LVAGHVIPTHYGEFWIGCKKGSDLSRRVYRGLESIRESIAGFEPAATFRGRPAFYRSIAKTSAETKSVLASDDELFPLQDAELEKAIMLMVRAVRGSLAQGLTELMQATANGNDFNTLGTEGYKARQAYIATMTNVLIPEMDRILARLRPLLSPWGFWRRSVARIWNRFIAIGRARPG
jgi:hypothetical protein